MTTGSTNHSLCFLCLDDMQDAVVQNRSWYEEDGVQMYKKVGKVLRTPAVMALRWACRVVFQSLFSFFFFSFVHFFFYFVLS